MTVADISRLIVRFSNDRIIESSRQPGRDIPSGAITTSCTFQRRSDQRSFIKSVGVLYLRDSYSTPGMLWKPAGVWKMDCSVG